MKEELIKTAMVKLELVAQKMGVAVEHLYTVLTRQGVAEGVIAISYCIAFVGVFLGASALFKKGVDYKPKGDYDDGAFGYYITGIILMAGSLIGFFALMYRIRYLINPEYFALEYIKNLF